jgi:hypothetical protein
LACTQGLSISLPDTLAHCYTPHCTSGPFPCIYKREVQGLPAEKRALAQRGRRADGPALFFPLATLVTPTTSTLVQDNTRLVPPLVFHPAPTHLGRGTQRQFHSSVQGPPGSKTPTVVKTPTLVPRHRSHLICCTADEGTTWQRSGGNEKTSRLVCLVFPPAEGPLL